MWNFLLLTGIVICATGAVFGYIKYFRDDGYVPQFTALASKDAQLEGEIVAERAARVAGDANIVALQAALAAAIDAEIALRVEQDAYLLWLVTGEVTNRTAEQARLHQLLQNETDARLARDTLFFSELLNISMRIDVMLAYDIVATTEFAVLFANVSSLQAGLASEAATRNASDTQQALDDTWISDQIALLTVALNNEIAIRVANESTLIAAVEAALNGTVTTINNQPPVAHAFTISSANGGYTIGSGAGPKSVSVKNNALYSLGGLTANATTGNINFSEGYNVAITADANSVNFALRQLPPSANSYRSTGALGTDVEWNTACAATDYWNFDATCLDPGFQIQTYSPSPDSGNSGFIFNETGVYMVEVSMRIVAKLLGSHLGGQSQLWSMALCVNTRDHCRLNPADPGVPVTSYGMNYEEDSTNSALLVEDLRFFDVLLDTTVIIDASTHIGHGVYPQWKTANQGDYDSPVFNTMYVTYEVTRLQ